jgi:hypothetical protein
MPYDMQRRGNRWVVIKKTTGEVVGTHPNRRKAKKHLSALYFNVVKKETNG